MSFLQSFDVTFYCVSHSKVQSLLPGGFLHRLLWWPSSKSKNIWFSREDVITHSDALQLCRFHLASKDHFKMPCVFVFCWIYILWY